MPRDGSNIYSQPFPDVVEDTTIESTVYNGFTNDVAQDLNTARPIVAGGTGATSAADARFNLATEVATQVVTNYDSHVWSPGSFRSASSASGQPVASHAFGGWCYIGEALANPPTNQNVVVHAFDFDALANTALLYTRQKKAGVWSDWSITTTEDNQAGARQAIYAAPFDALAYNGMQVNGSMEVSQEKGATATTGAGYVIDGFKISTNGTMVVSAGQASSGPAGFTNYLTISVSTAEASIGAASYYALNQLIEGYRISRLAWGTASASPITIGFWSNHFRAGVYSVSVRNGAVNRAYATSYTQAASNVWQYNTVTIPGDTAGTWTADNSVGITVFFPMAAGVNNQAPSPNTWAAGSYIAVASQVNGVGATTDRFRITGVVVLPGIEAPSAARSPLIMRPYGQELVTCQRYWAAVNAAWTGYAIGTALYSTTVQYPTQMRIQPTITSSQGVLANGGFSVRSASSIGLASTIWGGATPTNQNAAGFLDTLYLDARL